MIVDRRSGSFSIVHMSASESLIRDSYRSSSLRSLIAPPAGLAALALTRLTFMDEHGTETELRDVVHGGRARHGFRNQLTSRGRTFVAADGSAALFEADEEEVDTLPD